MRWNTWAGDVLEWAARYDGPPFHAMLCDPPYHLTSITERFGKDGAFQRASRGFMGKQWDGGDVAFRPETWAALAAHLHPGGFIMAFGGSRGFHRLAIAVEDAGLIIHPAVVWLNGAGFPKATRIDTQIDKAAGAEREVVKTVRKLASAANVHPGWERPWAYNDDGTPKRTMDITAPATPLAQTWAGHRYGLQALKPAAEFIVVAQKPYAGRPVDSITATGAGAFNVDGARLSADGLHEVPPGRWPANLALTHAPACTPAACVDGCPVKALGEQSGVSVSTGRINDHDEYHDGVHEGYKRLNKSSYTHKLAGQVRTYDGEGTAARFFHNSDYLLERMETEAPFRYVAKADRFEREAGLSSNGNRANVHPTVKPIALTTWLATLLLPPDAYAPRRLLVPFAGVGSEMLGGLFAGWDVVQGIEQSSEYAAIGWQRLAWWHDLTTLDFDTALERAKARVAADEERKQKEDGGQLTLWNVA